MLSRISRLLALAFLLACGSSDSGPTGSQAVAWVDVAPSTANVMIGRTQQFTATLYDSSGHTLTGRTVTWSTVDAGIASVNRSTGLAKGLADGWATITATSGANSGSATLVVSAPVAVVTVGPGSASITVCTTQQFTATLQDATGNALYDRTVTWSTSNASVASVNSSTGLAAGVAAGTATITATAEGKTGSAALTVSVLGCGFGLDQFALIPAGTFQMGSNNGSSDEKPVHSVTISHAFYLQKTEVTNGQWQAVMGTNASAFHECGDACPVADVSWDDVQTFLQRLNASTPGVTYRLPTEAEWEYAARAGTTGDAYGPLDAIAWYSANSGMHSQQVAGKQANAWGLYDMLGNVEEWVNDWYGSGYYAVSPAADPPGPASGSYGVLRGGWSAASAILLRSAARLGYYAHPARNNINGFRLARNP